MQPRQPGWGAWFFNAFLYVNYMQALYLLPSLADSRTFWKWAYMKVIMPPGN